MDYDVHSSVRLNVIIALSSWGRRDICEEIAAPQVTRVEHPWTEATRSPEQCLQHRCVRRVMLTVDNVWKFKVTGPF
jgi:hypothetical protein